jgi:hypothetical protein
MERVDIFGIAVSIISIVVMAVEFYLDPHRW